MRKTLALLAVSTSLCAGALACSSSDTPSDTPPDQTPGLGSSSGGSTSSSSGTSGSTTSASSTSTSSGGGDGGGGGGGDGGGGGGGEGGVKTDGGAGSQCNGKTQPEVESNDTTGTATPITTGICGVLSNGADVDYAKFVLPANATNFSFNQASSKPQVDYFLNVGATRVPLTGTLPFQPGDTYYIEVRNKQNTSVDYRVEVTIKTP